MTTVKTPQDDGTRTGRKRKELFLYTLQTTYVVRGKVIFSEASVRLSMELRDTFCLGLAQGEEVISGGSKGGARNARPHLGPNSFIFMQFWG